MIWDVVVVGAGIAGLTCARRLHQAGYQVLVLEKSRGLGGRMATRRLDQQPVDHGCRFLAGQTPLMTQLIEQLRPTGQIVPWQANCYQLEARGNRQLQPPQVRWIAPQGMSAIARPLAADLTIQRQTRVTTLVPTSAAWQVQLEAGEPAAARAVVLAVPAPQAEAMLHLTTAELEPTVSKLAQVKFEASLTVLAGYRSAPVLAPADAAGWMVYGNAESPFAWVGLDSSKRPSAAQSVVVVQSSDRFAQPWLETYELAQAGQLLLAQTSDLIGVQLSSPAWQQQHRWRYAIARSIGSGEPIYTQQPLPLACCGDWCSGQGIDAALTAGWAAAAAIHRGLAPNAPSDRLTSKLFA